jgi:LacI family transcriptional regulator
LLLSGTKAVDIAPALAAWISTHRPEVIASNWPIVPEALRLTAHATTAGGKLMRDIVVASLDLNPDCGSNAGMRQNHRVVGERAVEQLAILMRMNQRGLIEPRNRTFVEGEWVDGSDVPPVTR